MSDPQEFPGRPDPAPADDADAQRKSLLRRFFDGAKLRNFPSKRADKDLVLAEILRRLPRREEFTERELNEALKEYYADFATLRREMVDAQLLSRNAGIYRLGEKGAALLGE